MLEYRYYTSRTFVLSIGKCHTFATLQKKFFLFSHFFFGGDGRLSNREFLERVLSLSKSRFDSRQELLFDEFEHNSELCRYAASGENCPNRLKSCRKLPK